MTAHFCLSHNLGIHPLGPLLLCDAAHCQSHYDVLANGDLQSHWIGNMLQHARCLLYVPSSAKLT
jgi:hypothetical protein